MKPKQHKPKVRILERSNVQVPIKIMPLGVDPTRYNPEEVENMQGKIRTKLKMR